MFRSGEDASTPRVPTSHLPVEASEKSLLFTAVYQWLHRELMLQLVESAACVLVTMRSESHCAELVVQVNLSVLPGG